MADVVTWSKVTPNVEGMVRRIINEYRHELLEARIGLLFRSEAQKSGDKLVYGKARKVTDDLQPLLEKALDFIIWIAEDKWMVMSEPQRMGLLHHELMHCTFNDAGNATMRAHDIEEFMEVVAVWGNWRLEVEQMQRAIEVGHQAGLPFPGLDEKPKKKRGEGEVVALDPAIMGSGVTMTLTKSPLIG